MMRRLPVLMLLAILPLSVTAQEEATADAEKDQGPVTLDALAADADYIGLAQVKGRDYEEVREVPSKGSAFLRPLVTYRHTGDLRQPPGELVVYEEGFGENKCYYPERRNEGHRFLVFLDKQEIPVDEEDTQEGYVGTRPGCMLPVYVTEDNQYALRYPIEGLEVDESLVRDLSFADPDAFTDSGEDLSYQRGRELREQGLVRQVESGRFVYTKGIYLSDISDSLRDAPAPDQGARTGSE